MTKMRTIIIAAMLSFFLASPLLAGEKVFTLGVKNCYEYNLDESQVLIINTAAPLTKSKELVVNDQKSTENANDLGKSILGRLDKMPDVNRVILAYRQIAIFKFPFPRTWEQILPEVLKTTSEVLCSK